MKKEKNKKVKLTGKEKVEAYMEKPWYKRMFTFLSKKERTILKELKNARRVALTTVKEDFDMENSYEVRDWNLWFGSKQSLFDITTNIKKNQVTALIGKNGSGKSTFLKCLNRMNNLLGNVKTTGNIYFFNGTNLYSPIIPQAELTTRVGMIFQKPTPFPMSIYDNVAYGPRNHGITKKAILDKIVESSLKDAALWDEVKDKLSDYGSSLSGGQQQRLCIARAIALKPEVLLMDEPTGGLDPIATTKVENLILKLKEKYTIVLVTHSMNQAQRISDNTIFFYKGSICEQGPTKQLFTNPKEKKTMDYILGR